MNWESLFELIGFCGVLFAIFFFFRGGRHEFPTNSGTALKIVLVVSLIKYFINAAEWSELFSNFNFDYTEDYLDDLWPFVWFLFFFTIIMELSAESIRQSEKRYRMLFDNTIDAILVFDREGKSVNFNAAAFRLTGYNNKELKQLKIKDILPALESGSPQKTFFQENNNYRKEKTFLLHKNGNEIAVELNQQVITFEGEKSLLTVVRDISEKLREKEEFVKIEKLEALGVLAGGIAHDFNNFLMGIMGNVSILQLEFYGDDKIYHRLVDMEKAVVRAKGLTQQLLTFAMGGKPVKMLSNVGELIQETAQFVLRGSNVKPEFCIDPSLYLSEVDRDQIGQVITNLVINSDQAMPEGGIVFIDGRNEELYKSNYLELPPGPYLKIMVKDSGIGISKENLVKIFDPYFSTKEQGSGLGLAVVNSIVEKHQGKITVISGLGKGTTFFVYLPASEQIMVVEKELQADLTNRCATVLVMDDESCIREVAKEMLSSMGFGVETAESGLDAIAAYRKALEKGKPYDAVLMDLTIPGGMGGREAMQELLKIDPNVKAVVSSGYSNNPVMSNYRDYGFKGVLQKPYLLKDLRKMICSLIASDTI